MEKKIMANKQRSSQPRRQTTTKASSTFNLADDFERGLLRTAQEQVQTVYQERKNRINFDDLISRIIGQVLSISTKLQAAEIATATNRILNELVQLGAIEGTLPNDERIKSTVRKHLKTRSEPVVAAPDARLIETAPQMTLPSVPHGFRAADEAQTHSVAEQNRTVL